MSMLKNKLVYLHTGCKWSEPWDESFRVGLNKLGYEYIECDLATVVVDRPGVFIGRFNESCLQYKEIYEAKSRQFEWCWPEPSAFNLYDDKFLQAQYLSVNKRPQPFYEIAKDHSFYWDAYPAVQKKSNGSSSKNVKLVKSRLEVEPPCLLQEFCPGNDRDYRITVIGDQVTMIQRKNRRNDFRASGSGKIVRLAPEPDISQLCWEICQEAGWATMCFDIVKKEGEWVILEMSYTYALYAITQDTKYCHLMPGCNIADRTEHPVDTLLKYLFKRGKQCQT